MLFVSHVEWPNYNKKEVEENTMLEKKQNHEYIQVCVLFGLLIFITFLGWIGPFLESSQEDWQIHEVHVAEGYRPYLTENVQVFIENSEGIPVLDGNVSLEARHVQSGTSIKKWMHHLDEGLYEAECLFTESGTWQVNVKVRSNRHSQTFRYTLTVQQGASTIDPKDLRK
ncbi:hypothetical protein [Alkalicoccobacillus murimartini]|uniref:YtkA-like domain-containing protein n=1 Tax=Alkalicoccobacillus murimartini TaxID=171685 RepID=A0ABT9YC36_9BACI|nr:hypothetical protein [Alkalicoccobacillus murimartini]MDQ0205284.1 hypothetical protein [Alkalicoccobacillus murimartini]